MFVKVGTREFRVQNVYSARDIKQSRALDNPGGLRQLVDNLALSLKRRFAFAEVALVDRINDPVTGEPVATYVPLGQGFAMCHWKDNFAKKAGRTVALYRALRSAAKALTAEEADGIAAEAGHGSLLDLKLAVKNIQNPPAKPTFDFSGDDLDDSTDGFQ